MLDRMDHAILALLLVAVVAILALSAREIGQEIARALILA